MFEDDDGIELENIFENSSSYFQPIMSQYGGLEIDKEYIQPVQDFIEQNKLSGEFGDSGKNLLSRRSIRVSLSSDKPNTEFSDEFKQFCLQVARNLAPYRTGNLRENITLVTVEDGFYIKYNSKGTAEYVKFLDNGYPSNKWKGFIEYTRKVIRMLVAKYMAGTLTTADILLYGRGGIGVVGGQGIKRATSFLRSTRKVTGFERQLMKKSVSGVKKRLTPTKVAELDIQREQNYAKSVGKKVNMAKQRKAFREAQWFDKKMQNNKRVRSSSRTRGG